MGGGREVGGDFGTKKKGSAVKVDVMQKSPELVVHERMAQGEK